MLIFNLENKPVLLMEKLFLYRIERIPQSTSCLEKAIFESSFDLKIQKFKIDKISYQNVNNIELHNYKLLRIEKYS